MTPEQIQAKLALLAEAVDKLRQMPHATLDEFRSDDRNIDAALRRLQVAIQIEGGATALPPPLRKNLPAP